MSSPAKTVKDAVKSSASSGEPLKSKLPAGSPKGKKSKKAWKKTWEGMSDEERQACAAMSEQEIASLAAMKDDERKEFLASRVTPKTSAAAAASSAPGGPSMPQGAGSPTKDPLAGKTAGKHTGHRTSDAVAPVGAPKAPAKRERAPTAAEVKSKADAGDAKSTRERAVSSLDERYKGINDLIAGGWQLAKDLGKIKSLDQVSAQDIIKLDLYPKWLKMLTELSKEAALGLKYARLLKCLRDWEPQKGQTTSIICFHEAMNINFFKELLAKVNESLPNRKNDLQQIEDFLKNSLKDLKDIVALNNEVQKNKKASASDKKSFSDLLEQANKLVKALEELDSRAKANWEKAKVALEQENPREALRLLDEIHDPILKDAGKAHGDFGELLKRCNEEAERIREAEQKDKEERERTEREAAERKKWKDESLKELDKMKKLAQEANGRAQGYAQEAPTLVVQARQFILAKKECSEVERQVEEVKRQANAANGAKDLFMTTVETAILQLRGFILSNAEELSTAQGFLGSVKTLFGHVESAEQAAKEALMKAKAALNSAKEQHENLHKKQLIEGAQGVLKDAKGLLAEFDQPNKAAEELLRDLEKDNPLAQDLAKQAKKAMEDVKRQFEQARNHFQNLLPLIESKPGSACTLYEQYTPKSIEQGNKQVDAARELLGKMRTAKQAFEGACSQVKQKGNETAQKQASEKARLEAVAKNKEDKRREDLKIKIDGDADKAAQEAEAAAAEAKNSNEEAQRLMNEANDGRNALVPADEIKKARDLASEVKKQSDAAIAAAAKVREEANKAKACADVVVTSPGDQKKKEDEAAAAIKAANKERDKALAAARKAIEELNKLKSALSKIEQQQATEAAKKKAAEEKAREDKRRADLKTKVDHDADQAAKEAEAAAAEAKNFNDEALGLVNQGPPIAAGDAKSAKDKSPIDGRFNLVPAEEIKKVKDFALEVKRHSEVTAQFAQVARQEANKAKACADAVVSNPGDQQKKEQEAATAIAAANTARNNAVASRNLAKQELDKLKAALAQVAQQQQAAEKKAREDKARADAEKAKKDAEATKEGDASGYKALLLSTLVKKPEGAPGALAPVTSPSAAPGPVSSGSAPAAAPSAASGPAPAKAPLSAASGPAPAKAVPSAASGAPAKAPSNAAQKPAPKKTK